ncbi:MAG: alpha/beta hydrolase [Clostridiales bacterium]|jgi:acetyl esterase/lipase|nr:alpha/beta hydrolase [Clostridiales bacterium]
MKASTFFKTLNFFTGKLYNAGYDKFVKERGIETREDIVYDAEFPEIRLGDFYRAKSVAPLPVVIYIHGGGFVAGNKRDRRYYCAEIAASGYAVFCVNYGVAPTHRFPFGILSVIKALGFLDEKAREYGLDMSRTVLNGDSAGAYMAACVSAAARSEDYRTLIGAPETAVIPKGLIMGCGNYDLIELTGRRSTFDLLNKILIDLTGWKDFSHFDEYGYRKVFNPSLYMEGSNAPEILMIYALRDRFCKGHAELWIKAFSERGILCESISDGTKVHNYHLRRQPQPSKDAKAKIVSFLNKIKTL